MRPAGRLFLKPVNELPPVATVAEVAAYLRICSRQVLRLDLPRIRLSKRVIRFRREDVLAWLEAHRAGGKAAA